MGTTVRNWWRQLFRRRKHTGSYDGTFGTGASITFAGERGEGGSSPGLYAALPGCSLQQPSPLFNIPTIATTGTEAALIEGNRMDGLLRVARESHYRVTFLSDGTIELRVPAEGRDNTYKLILSGGGPQSVEDALAQAVGEARGV